MKTQVGFFSIVIFAIVALAPRAAEAEDGAQAAGEPSEKASTEADLERMKRTATRSCERLGHYLEQIVKSEPNEQIPTKVYELLQHGCGKAEALASAVSAGDAPSAKRHFLVATRAMAKVSRWLLRREEKRTLVRDDEKLNERLQTVVKRMGKRLQRLRKRVDDTGLEVDFTLSYSIYEAAVTAIQEQDVQAAREHLKALREEIFKLEDEIARQQEEVL